MPLAHGETKKIIQETALQVLRENASGMHFSDLMREVRKRIPSEVNPNSVPNALVSLERSFPGDVTRPAKGVWSFAAPIPAATPGIPPLVPSSSGGAPGFPDEDEFYEPFAEYLKGPDLDECTRAMALGGHALKLKWNTPDVMGVYRSRITDIFKGPDTIVSVEIKNDISDRDLIIGFGQACSYRLFSHKVYLVIPKDANEDAKGRIDALCQLYGIGLILFDRRSPKNPDWEIRMRPSSFQPDLFYVNEYLKDIATELFGP